MKFRTFIWLPLALFLIMGVSSCKKEFSIEKASGSLKDSLNNCSPIEVAGHYKAGTAVASSDNYVNIKVNVTKTGSFSIFTDTSNGFSFSASGTFHQTGIQQIKLKASGTPLVNSSTFFNCYFDTSTCTFSIPVGDSAAIITPADTLGVNTWQFTDETNRSFHSGLIDTTDTWFEVDSLQNRLQIKGWPGFSSPLNHDTLFVIAMFLPQSYIDTGFYSITSGVGANNVFAYENKKVFPGTGANIYFFYYYSDHIGTPGFTFHFQSWDSNLKLLKGTFSGTSVCKRDYNDLGGEPHLIHGSFIAKLR